MCCSVPTDSVGRVQCSRPCASTTTTRGLAFEGPALELDGDPSNLLRELRWAATEATPWLYRRALDVTTALTRPLIMRAI